MRIWDHSPRQTMPVALQGAYLSLVCYLALIAGQPATGAESRAKWLIGSPGGKLSVIVTSQPALALSVRLNGRTVLPESPLGITLNRSGVFPRGFVFSGKTARKIDETYSMPVGKRSRCRNRANEITLDFANAEGARVSVIVRAYDEGAAYRYRIGGNGKDTVIGETSSFRIPAGSKGWFAAYAHHYESIYAEHSNLTGIHYDIQLPALFETPQKSWIFITEADVDGTYSGARLKLSNPATGLLSYQLADQPSSALPWKTPWRVAIVVDSLRHLVESTMVNNLAKPSMIKDASWIRPGTGIFPWITGNEAGWGPCRVNNNGSLERMKKFVDQASEMGWKWIEFDNALALNTPFGGAPEKWMDCPWFPQLTAYAGTKNISVYGWDLYSNLDTPEKRAKYLDWYVENGFKGIKVDFLDSDTQKLYAFREAIAKDCADRHLMISYHGDITPRGMQRTWPNIATHEGVLGQEYFLFSNTIPTPEYNVNLAFIRNVPGSMDYTPASFSSRRAWTAAHEMALPVVFESGWQSLGFYPENGAAVGLAKEYLRNLPSAWDDIRFVAGRPGELAVLARRKGRDWWIAGINAGKQRTIAMSLDFLKPGVYSTKMYRDNVPQSGDGLEVTVTNHGGVNAIVSWIEVWSNRKPAVAIDYKKPSGMDPAPAGHYLIACNDCGTAEGRKHLLNSSGQSYTWGENDIPTSVLSANDPARTLDYSESALVYQFRDMDRSASYIVRLMFVNNSADRMQSVEVNGRTVQDAIALPKQEILCRSFAISGNEVTKLTRFDVMTTGIIADAVRLDTSKAVKITVPANGGFGLIVRNSAL